MVSNQIRKSLLAVAAVLLITTPACQQRPDPTLELDVPLTMVHTVDPATPVVLPPTWTPALTPSNTPWPTDPPPPSRIPPSPPTSTPPPDLLVTDRVSVGIPNIQTSLVFVREHGDRLALYSWGEGDTVPRTLLSGEHDIFYPLWSPAGRQLAYLKTNDFSLYQQGAGWQDTYLAAATNLYLLIAGLETPLGPTGNMYISEAVWSPDSSKIAFAGRELDAEGNILGGKNIYQTSLTSRKRTLVIETSKTNIGCSSPTWDPDSAYILARCRALMAMGLVISPSTGTDSWYFDAVAERVTWKPTGDEILIINGWYPLETINAAYLYQKSEGVKLKVESFYDELAPLGVQEKPAARISWAPQHPDRFFIQSSDLIQIVDQNLGRVLSLRGDFSGLEGQCS